MENNDNITADSQAEEDVTTQEVTELESQSDSSASDSSNRKEVVDENTDDSNENSQVEETNEDSDNSKDEPDSQEDDEESEADKEAMDALKKVRNEAKNLRKRLREAENTIAELQANSDGAVAKERDDYKQKLEELQLQVRNDKTRELVIDAARKAGAIEPDAIADIIASKNLVKYEEEKPTNVAKVVADMKDTYKRLFAGVNGSGNIGNRHERGGKYEGMSSTDLIASAFKNNDE